MYTDTGASFNPNIKLNKRNATQTTANDSAKPSMMNAITIGATITIIAFRCPSASQNKPLSIELSMLPNGCQ